MTIAKPATESPRVGRWSSLDPSIHRQVLVALMLLLAYGFFRQDSGWNQNSRLDLVRALVNDQSTIIDPYHKNTGDKAFFEGHYYSDKAPGSAIIGIPGYLAQRAGYRLVGAGRPAEAAEVQALSFAVSGVLTVALVILLLRFLTTVVGERWAMLMSLGYGVGSIAFPFATMYFGHAASACFLFAAFYQLWRWRTDPRIVRPLTAGFLGGLAVITEVPVVLGVAVLGGYALWIGRRRAAWFVLGGMPAAAVLMAYDWVAFGNPLAIGYQYSTFFGELNQEGIVSVVAPTWSRAESILAGTRGLIRYAPWFVLAPLGILAARRAAVRAEVVVCVGICVAFTLYNSGAINPLGGWTPGPRYLLPALPFATILVALVPVIVRPVVVCLLAVAVAVFVVATATLPAAPTAFVDPLADLWIPRLLAGEFAPTIASLRFGLDGGVALAILVTAITMGLVALALSFRGGSSATRWTGLTATALVGLVAVLAMPFVP